MQDDPLKPPTGLRAPGKQLWSAVAAKYVLTPAELTNLAEACRTKDELDRLYSALTDNGLVNGQLGGTMTAQGAWQPVTTEFASGFVAFLRDPRVS